MWQNNIKFQKMAEIRKPGPKFPPTRRLDSAYEDIVPHGCQNERVTKALTELVQSPFFSHQSRTQFHNNTTYTPVAAGTTLNQRTEKVKASLIQKISELKQTIHRQEEIIQTSLPSVKALISSARAEPALTAVTLNYCGLSPPTLSRVKCFGVVKCCKCSQRALPFTRCCLEHIHLSKDQSLYRCCTATDHQTKHKCENPVSDILSASSTCHKHYRPIGDVGVVKPPMKRVVGRGGFGKGVLSGSRSKMMKTSTKKTTLPTILKPNKSPTPVKPPTVPDQPPPETIQPKSSLDDLLTLGPPLQSLDLPPLEADLGDIMMAGEESGGEGD